MFKDFLSYLTDDILCKVDRASMYASLETRVPLLDRNVIEEAYSLPLDLKIREGKTKWILREILSKHLPKEVFEKPKHGFAIPISKWMRTDLKEWVNDTLSNEILNSHNLFNKEVLTTYKDQHLSGSHNHEHKLWSILQFNQWYIENY